MINIVQNINHEFKNINETKILKHFEMLQNQILPKFLNSINNPQKQQHWQNSFNFIFPQSHLNYSSEEAYLEKYSITKEYVIKNSILQIFPNIDKDDLFDLCTHFMPLMENHKIRVLINEEIAVYFELMNLMEYVRQIQELVERYKKPYSDNKGTAHRSSSLKVIVKTQINMLENRLKGSFFRIQNKDEIEQTELSLRLLKKSQEEQYKNIMENFNYLNLLVGLDAKLLNFTKNETIALEQVLNFHNGIRSTPLELIRSVIINFDAQLNKANLSAEDKANNILYITRYFFHEEFKKAEKQRNNLTCNKKHIGKPYAIKTILHQIPIFAYKYKNSNDFISEYIESIVNGIAESQNLFESGNITAKEVSWIHIGRNMVNTRKEFGFLKEELKALLFFIEQMQVIQEENILPNNTIQS
ncbi:MAG: hypothetical protein LT067_05505 [Sulfurovum sp.]|nr:hypothetical protein [Sulfurovum sp.]